MNELLKKPPFRLARVFYKLFRGAVRVLTLPLRPLPEGRFKAGARSFVLNFQHSLPTEFVVNKGDTVVQVGTPNPKTLLRFVRAVGSEGRLVVVEAMPTNQDRLEKTIRDHALANVTLIKAAACNENRAGEFAISPFWGDHKIPLQSIRMDNDLKPENAVMGTIQVQFVRLDDVLPAHDVDAVNYLSVTVNGAEAEVLKGATETLARSPRGTRVYAKGHALDSQGEPIHKLSNTVMQELGFRTKITRGEPSSTLDPTWRWRAGDLYAWKA